MVQIFRDILKKRVDIKKTIKQQPEILEVSQHAQESVDCRL